MNVQVKKLNGKLIIYHFNYILKTLIIYEYLPVKVYDLTKFPLVEESKRIKGRRLSDISYDASGECTPHSIARLKQFEKAIEPCLEGATLFIDEIKELSFFGIPDDGNVRSIYWRILLTYFSTQPANWGKEEVDHRDLYNSFVV